MCCGHRVNPQKLISRKNGNGSLVKHAKLGVTELEYIGQSTVNVTWRRPGGERTYVFGSNNTTNPVDAKTAEWLLGLVDPATSKNLFEEVAA